MTYDLQLSYVLWVSVILHLSIGLLLDDVLQYHVILRCLFSSSYNCLLLSFGHCPSVVCFFLAVCSPPVDVDLQLSYALWVHNCTCMLS